MTSPGMSSDSMVARESCMLSAPKIKIATPSLVLPNAQYLIHMHGDHMHCGGHNEDEKQREVQYVPPGEKLLVEAELGHPANLLESFCNVIVNVPLQLVAVITVGNRIVLIPLQLAACESCQAEFRPPGLQRKRERSNHGVQEPTRRVQDTLFDG